MKKMKLSEYMNIQFDHIMIRIVREAIDWQGFCVVKTREGILYRIERA